MKDYLSLIKFPHTIFALPFALLGFFLALQAEGMDFSLQKLVLVLLCMVFARSAAMAFNRYIDRGIDIQNKRTQNREIPKGTIKASNALTFTILNATAFIICAYFINKVCFLLSPVALFVILGYSYTKRFTALCHLILGLGLAMAPVGAYLAVTPYFSMIPVLIGATVLFWVGGFDIIYALQDEEFDKKLNLFSIPVHFGQARALFIARIFHACSAALLLVVTWLMVSSYFSLSWLTYLASGIFILLLVFQHSLVKVNDLKNVNLAFFSTNGFASIILCSLIILDFYL